jgi:poly-gamma-glutamate synthesis protein (capsule biosynthesis protein)
MLGTAQAAAGSKERDHSIRKGVLPPVACDRRRFLDVSGAAALGVWAGARPAGEASSASLGTETQAASSGAPLRVFLCGDVMTGRGIDQVLPHPSKPEIRESYMRSALGYVELAEEVHGRIRRPVDFAYIWGEALVELETRSPDLRVINLETSVTTSDEALPKGINYRMHPANVPCLRAAAIDCCVLANNHVLDWGVEGLLETLDTLQGAGMATAGAGRDLEEAERPAAFEVAGKGRLLVFGFGHPSSGTPRDWAADEERPGVSVLPDLSGRAADWVAERVRRFRRRGDLVVTSIHWGGNWGYSIPRQQRQFAQRLIDAGAADVVHGHSSHHPRAIEVYEGRPILYGCGDFINDYEGISGHEEFRSDLVLAYFVTLDPASGRLLGLEMTPFRTRRFRLERVARRDAEWVRATLDREGRRLGTRVELASDGTLELGWS